MPKSTIEPSFDLDLVEAWRQGGLGTKTIGPLPSHLAIALRHRLYRERRKMRINAHPDYHLAAQAVISLSTTETLGELLLIIYPANLAIDQALARAGIKPSNDPPDLD